jgi:hypothetical protein
MQNSLARPADLRTNGRFDLATITEDEARELSETFAAPGSGVPLFQAATANLNPLTEAKGHEEPDRGPLLIISGERDHTVPWEIANAFLQEASQHASRLTENLSLVRDSPSSFSHNQAFLA